MTGYFAAAAMLAHYKRKKVTIHYAEDGREDKSFPLQGLHAEEKELVFIEYPDRITTRISDPGLNANAITDIKLAPVTGAVTIHFASGTTITTE